MNVFLWILQWALAAMFLMAGGMKLMRQHSQLAADPRMGWAADFSPRSVRLIGVAEVAGAIGLVLPPLVDVAPILSPIAASGLVVLMAGAAGTHLRRNERPMIVLNLMLGVAAALVAAYRFGPESF